MGKEKERWRKKENDTKKFDTWGKKLHCFQLVIEAFFVFNRYEDFFRHKVPVKIYSIALVLLSFIFYED